MRRKEKQNPTLDAFATTIGGSIVIFETEDEARSKGEHQVVKVKIFEEKQITKAPR